MQPELAWIDTIAAPAVIVDDIGRPIQWNGLGLSAFPQARSLDETVRAPGVDLGKVAAEVARGNQRSGQTCDAVDDSGASWNVRIDQMGPGRAVVVFRLEEDEEDEDTYVPEIIDEEDDEPTAEILDFERTDPAVSRARARRWQVAGDVVPLAPRPGAPARTDRTHPRITSATPARPAPTSSPAPRAPQGEPERGFGSSPSGDDVVAFVEVEAPAVPTVDVRPSKVPPRTMRLGEAFSGASEPHLLVRAGRIEDANEAACAMLGVGTRGHLVGRRVADLAPPVVADDAEPWEVLDRAFDIAQRDGQASFRWAFRRYQQADLLVQAELTRVVNGGEVSCRFSWGPRGPADEPAEVSPLDVGRARLGLALARSIRPLLVRDNLDEAIAEALATIGSAIHADRCFLMLVEHEDDGDVVRNGRRFAWSADGVEREPDAAVQGAIDRGTVPNRWARVLSSGGVLHGDAEVFPPDEQAIMERYGVRSLAIVPIQRDGRRLIGFLGVDACSDRRAWQTHEIEILKGMADSFAGAFRLRDAATAVQAGHDRYEAAVHGADLGVWEADLAAMRITYTRGVDRLLGLSSDVVPTGVAEMFKLVHPDDREACRRLLDEHSQGRTAMIDAQLRVQLEQGVDKWVLLRGRVSERAADGTPLRAHGTLFDIDARKRLEDELRGARGVAERANASKSRFLANMSHEIRTPLNAVLGMAELLQGTALSRRQTDLVETLRTSGESLFALLNQIFDLSRIEAGNLVLSVEPFDLRALMLELRDVFRSRVEEKGLALEVRLDDRLPFKVLGDPLRFRQILMSLVDNAVKFTEVGGIVVEAWCPEPGDDLLVRIEVRDSGIGIPAEELPEVFGAFSQVDGSDARRHGGSGLGLAISSRLCELMGGGLDVISVPDSGSVFQFDIRLAAPDSGKRSATAGPMPVDLDVLVVEDNRVNQQVLDGMLKALGCAEEIRLADCGDDALEQLRQRTPDVILMDIQMPDMDGLECTQKIRERLGSRTRPWIIAVTASTHDHDRDRSLAVGMNDFLAKPLRQLELERAIERALRHVR